MLNSRDRAPYLLYIETLKPHEDISPASPYLHLFAKELGARSLGAAAAALTLCIGHKVALLERKSRVIRSWTHHKERLNSDSDSDATNDGNDSDKSASPSIAPIVPKAKSKPPVEDGSEPPENVEDRKSVDEEKDAKCACASYSEPCSALTQP